MAFRKETEEEKRAIIDSVKNQISIVNYASLIGLTPIQIGNGKYFTLKEHDSVRIDTYQNCFWRNSGIGSNPKGSVIDFCMNFTGKDLHGALEELTGLSTIMPDTFSVTESRNTINPAVKEKKVLVLPERAPNMRNVFAYLTKTRFLDQDVIQDFVDRKMLYQDKMNNCVFVSYDEEKNPSFACRRGTNPNRYFAGDVEGSNYEKSFFINNGVKKLIVAEGVVDVMSIMTLLKANDVDFKAYNYLALTGTEKYASLLNLVQENPLEQIILALDNDTAGLTAVQNILTGLKENEIVTELSLNLSGEKDWNEALTNVAKVFGDLTEINFLESGFNAWSLLEEPTVTITNSSHAFFEDNKVFPLSIADSLFKKFDAEQTETMLGSDMLSFLRTDFTIDYVLGAIPGSLDGVIDIGSGETMVSSLTDYAKSFLEDDSLKNILSEENYQKTLELNSYTLNTVVPYLQQHFALDEIQTNVEDGLSNMDLFSIGGEKDRTVLNELLGKVEGATLSLNLFGELGTSTLPEFNSFIEAGQSFQDFFSNAETQNSFLDILNSITEQCVDLGSQIVSDVGTCLADNGLGVASAASVEATALCVVPEALPTSDKVKSYESPIAKACAAEGAKFTNYSQAYPVMGMEM